jgi:hypothetical protein
VRTTGAHVVGPGSDVGERDARTKEISDLTAGFRGEQTHGERGDNTVAGFAPGEGGRGRAEVEYEGTENSKADNVPGPATGH